MRLSQIPKRKNRKGKKKRVGRGYGTGVGGHTVGKGMKGQKSRAGAKSMLGFEGGNVPLYRRLPKFRGFTNPTRKDYEPVNFADLEKHYKEGESVSMKTLKEKGIIKKRTKNVKILGKGELTKKLKFVGLAVSKKAHAELEKLGCDFKK